MKFFFNILILFIFFGCENKQIPQTKKTTNFTYLGNELISPFCEKIDNNTTIYITDYINEKNLKNNSKLGFLLSNLTKVELLKCNKKINIIELQLSNALKIGSNGTKMLSRKIKELKIKNLTDNNKILIGTYIISKKQLFIFAKLIDLKTANTLYANSISTPMTNEIKELEGLPTDEEILANEIYTPMHL